MEQKKKRWILSLSVLLSLALVCGLGVYFLFFHHYRGHAIDNPWSESDVFSIDAIQSIEKQKDRPFVILNLADVQLCDLDDFAQMNEIKRELATLVEQTCPDLITLTGDQTWSNENLISLKSLISWLDSFGIPYAPVFGNHDCGNEKDSAVLGRLACCDLYEKGKYSLFRRGPSNLGSLGNYAVNITEDGEIIKTLYFLDLAEEDRISDEQISWLKWNAEGIKDARGGEYAEAICFFHKPLPEYAKAYHAYLYGEEAVEAIGDVYVTYSLFGSEQNGFFEAAASVGVKDMVCGHQHGNCFTLQYRGVRLTFALKTGKLGGTYEGETITLDGATCISFDRESTSFDLVFAKD